MFWLFCYARHHEKAGNLHWRRAQPRHAERQFQFLRRRRQAGRQHDLRSDHIRQRITDLGPQTVPDNIVPKARFDSVANNFCRTIRLHRRIRLPDSSISSGRIRTWSHPRDTAPTERGSTSNSTTSSTRNTRFSRVTPRPTTRLIATGGPTSWPGSCSTETRFLFPSISPTPWSPNQHHLAYLD
jgi:hypothetical protein